MNCGAPGLVGSDRPAESFDHSLGLSPYSANGSGRPGNFATIPDCPVGVGGTQIHYMEAPPTHPESSGLEHLGWTGNSCCAAMLTADGHHHAGVSNPPGVHSKPDPPAYPSINCPFLLPVWTTDSQLVDDFGIKFSGKEAADYPAFRHRLATRYRELRHTRPDLLLRWFENTVEGQAKRYIRDAFAILEPGKACDTVLQTQDKFMADGTLYWRTPFNKSSAAVDPSKTSEDHCLNSELICAISGVSQSQLAMSLHSRTLSCWSTLFGLQ